MTQSAHIALASVAASADPLAGADGRTPFFGWRAVTAAFVVAVFGWGLGFYGPPVYLEVVRQSREWSVALISGAMTLHFAVGLGLIPNLPRLYRRFGLATVTVIAGVIMVAGVVGWATALTPWELYAAAILTGIGWSALGAVAVTAIVAPWFDAKRPLALGAAFNGGSVGGVIFSPLWVALIRWLGFLEASLIVGGVMIAVLVFLAVAVLRKTPEMLHQTPDGIDLPVRVSPTLASTLGPPAPSAAFARSRSFLTLCFGMTLALFAQTGLVAQLVSVLSRTLGTQGAGLTVGACGVAAVVGRLVAGTHASTATDWRFVAILSLLAQASGCGVLMAAGGGNPPLLILGVVLFGLGVGNAISIPPVIAGVEFEDGDVARVIALIVAISQGAYAIAPAAFGLIRQLGSDQLMFLAATLIQVGAITAYLLGRRSRTDKPTS